MDNFLRYLYSREDVANILRVLLHNKIILTRIIDRHCIFIIYFILSYIHTLHMYRLEIIYLLFPVFILYNFLPIHI